MHHFCSPVREYRELLGLICRLYQSELEPDGKGIAFEDAYKYLRNPNARITASENSYNRKVAALALAKRLFWEIEFSEIPENPSFLKFL